jgi:hypothetical protein
MSVGNSPGSQVTDFRGFVLVNVGEFWFAPKSAADWRISKRQRVDDSPAAITVSRDALCETLK